MTVGKKINVGEVLSKSTNLLTANPSIILIQLLPAVPSLISDVFSGPAIFSPIVIIATLLSAIFSVIASGAYAPVVREALQGRRLTIGEAFGHAYRRFWNLVLAGIVVGVIVILGSIALIVPGIIFATWYAYTTPAIMLEDKGAFDGMAASKAFGRDKKSSTFALFLTFLLVYIVVAIIGAVLSLGGGGRVIQTLLDIPLSAWTSVVIAYTYITCGPSATAPQAAQPGWQQPPSTMPGPTPVPQSASAFCANCGAPLQPDAKFCRNCGKPV